MENRRTRHALIGAAGFVAPRHMAAIKEIGGELVAAYDPHDSVGILDQYFPECEYFREFERFDRHLSKLGDIDYVSICSPNYLHDSHCRFAMRIGADAICEKPLVVQPHNLEELEHIEIKTGNRVWTILQCRIHPSVRAFFGAFQRGSGTLSVEVTYKTPRGRWYGYSWKGDEEKSGGILYNIGVHLFDLLAHLFGELKEIYHLYLTKDMAEGYFRLTKADVRFHLSTRMGHKPQRTITFPGFEDAGIDLSTGFEDLHTESYRNILYDQGYGIDEARKGIEICHSLKQWLSLNPAQR